MKKNMAGKSRISIILLMLIMVFSLSSCKGPAIADKDGAAIRYTMEEIDEAGYEGLFTLNSDDTFSPLPSGLPGYEGTTDTADPSRYIWYTDNGQDFTSLIPIVTPETPIVIIYNNDTTMPDKGSWYLERYKKMKGATIGAHIRVDSDKSMYLLEDGPLRGTSAYKTLLALESKDSEHELVEISGSDTGLPWENVEQNTDILRGLEHGKRYTFKYTQGTKIRKIDLIADTYAFQSYEIIPLSAPYKQTDKGYFIINLPIGLDNGFYYISDLGFFIYRGSAAVPQE